MYICMCTYKVGKGALEEQLRLHVAFRSDQDGERQRDLLADQLNRTLGRGGGNAYIVAEMVALLPHLLASQLLLLRNAL